MTLTTSGINYVVEVAFTTDPLGVPGAWTDITDYVRWISTRRGRNHELGKTAAGVATVRLDNRDRRFDPTYASSPYYPNVVPMRHLRIRATYAAVTYPVFYGFVEDWGQTWPAPAANAQGDAVIELQAVDAFKVFNMAAVRTIADEITTDAPVSWWSFGDPTTSPVAHAEGSHGADLPIESGMALGAAGPLTGGATALDVSTVVDGTRVSTPDLAPDVLHLSVEFWLNAAALGIWVLYEGDHSGGGNIFSLSTVAGPIWRFQYTRPNGDSVVLDLTGSTVTNGVWQHWVFTRNGGTVTAYRDGVQVATESGPSSVMAVESDAMLFVAQTAQGSIAHLAIHDHVLDANRIAAHAAANLDRFTNVASGAAIGYVLDEVGWPVGLRDLDTGVSSVTIDPSGPALDALQDIAEDTDHGILFMAADNTATFIDRETLFKALTAAATFGDSTGETPYADLVLAYDDQDLWTEVDASSEAGRSTVTDATSTTRYGRRTLDVSGSNATANEVADVANGLLNRYKDPAVRPRTLTMNKPAAFVQQLSRLIGDRVTLKRRPPGGGTITVDAIIEGIDHDAGPDGWLTTTFSLVPVEPNVFWILANATYGVMDSTTRLGW